MFDFPTAPVLNDVFTPLPGVSYQWDGIAWVYAQTATAITIEQLLPAYMVAGGTDMSMRITGIGFMPTSVVYLDGIATTTTVFVSTEEVRCTMLASVETVARTVQVTVQNGTTISNAMPFNYVVTPTLTSMTPDTIDISNAVPVITTLVGTGFHANSDVWLRNRIIPSTFVSTTQMTATVQPSDGGAGDSLYVWVQTGSAISSNQLLFKFVA